MPWCIDVDVASKEVPVSENYIEVEAIRMTPIERGIWAATFGAVFARDFSLYDRHFEVNEAIAKTSADKAATVADAAILKLRKDVADGNLSTDSPGASLANEHPPEWTR